MHLNYIIVDNIARGKTVTINYSNRSDYISMATEIITDGNMTTCENVKGFSFIFGVDLENYNIKSAVISFKGK